MATRRSHDDLALPDLDDRLVRPDTPYEMLDGRLIRVSPADLPHGIRHAQIAAVIEAHVAAEFDVAVDMLTRTSLTDDIAPDISVFPHAPHPETGGRQLDHLSFEIVSTRSLGKRSLVSRKAFKLATRGVRRVFAIHIKQGRALEWSAANDDWVALDAAGSIEDLALAVALPVGALIHTAKADDVIARALLERQNPVIAAAAARQRAEGVAEGLAQGVAKGLATAILATLSARGMSLPEPDRTRVLHEQDVELLRRWLSRAATCRRPAEVFTDS